MSARPAPRLYSFILFAIVLLASSGALASDKWIKSASKAKLFTPPFRSEFYAGETLRIKVKEGAALRLIVSGEAEGSRVAIIPMNGKTRAGRKTVMEDETLIFTESTDQADVLAAKVVTGKVKIEGDYDPMAEIIIEEGQEGEVEINPYKDTIAGRFVNLSDFRSTVTFKFMLDGQDVSNTSDRHRTLSLEFKGSSRAKNWKGGADKVIVKVHHGKIKFKAGHPFSGR